MELKKFEENRKLIDRIKEICDEKEILKDVDFEYELSMHDSIRDADQLNDIVYEHEILYTEYPGEAMDYLKEHDPTLEESLGIAREFGFDLGQLRANTLASLLHENNNRNDWHTVMKLLDEDDFDTDADRRDHILGQILEE